MTITALNVTHSFLLLKELFNITFYEVQLTHLTLNYYAVTSENSMPLAMRTK